MDQHLSQINYLAVLASAISNMIIGAMWYSPILFAKSWMNEMGMKAEDMEKTKAGAKKGYIISMIGSLVAAFVMAALIARMDVQTLFGGIKLGLAAAIGFIATTQAANYSFESRSMKLYLINVGYTVVTYVIMSVILMSWR
ncbi:MAG: DUF1761 domain-containing protein [Ignavibacteria bacterium]|nr:DUF1761 domain-containing protein [Ignavibacteria bacterium]MBI3765603.1 DUF1761 domain-containing protein [Ignavibacteriales bacterium]